METTGQVYELIIYNLMIDAELLDAEYIQHSKALYGATTLFQKKHDGSLQLCIDYQVLNKVIIKNRYHIPLIAELFIS